MSAFFSSLRSLFGGKSKAAVLDPVAFTEDVASRVRASLPSADVRVAGELELAIDLDDSGGNRVFLNNAYQMYLQESPKRRNDLVDRYVRSFVEAGQGLERSAEAIIPVVKDRAWLDEIRESTRNMGGDVHDKIYEEINEVLVVVYAIDTLSNIAYINANELDALGVEREQLRSVAVRNLRGLLPGIEVQRGEKLCMVVADGNYEASLLLFSDLWVREAEKMIGEPVAAVPARDLLLFADSADAEAVKQLRQLATKARAEATYALTDRLFVLRSDRWELF